MAICKFDKCRKRATYNIKGQKVVLYCNTHKKENMIDIRNKTCIEPNCETRPNYNIKGQKNPLYCNTHKKENMVDVKNKTCIELNCETLSCYNIKGQKTPLYCNTHKKDNMVDIKNNICIEPNCETRSSYNMEGRKALYCSVHKKESMVNVTSKNCIEPNCKKRPNYNIEGQKAVLYCNTHKKDNMVDVNHKTCIESNCKIRPNYNIKGQKVTLYCYAHKKENMVDVKHKTCIEPNCEIRSSCNIEGQKKPLYCNTHKKDNMIDVTSKRCKTPLCYTMVQKKYDGYCFFCFIHTFPDSLITRNYKTKEREVTEYITKTFSQYTWNIDKKIKDGCSKRRPDLLLDMGDQVIIIEIDENQHIDYDCSCENKRLMEISQDLEHRPIIFIRFNPDEYNIGETKIQSCFGYNMKGVCRLKPKYINEWNERLLVIKQQIEYWTNPLNKTNKTIEVIQLYFDNFKVPNNNINNILVIKQKQKTYIKKKSIIINELCI